MDIEQSKFTGFAVLELMGHRKETGFVTTEYFGGAALFRVDTPAIEAYEETTRRSSYAITKDGTEYVPAGALVKHPAIESRTVYVSPNSLYALNPCTEAVAREAAKQKFEDSRPPILLKLPERPVLTAGVEDEEESPF